MICNTIILDLYDKGDIYFTIFRSVQQVVSAHSVINNYLLECFKIERTQLLITCHSTVPYNYLFKQQILHIIWYNTTLYNMPEKWVAWWMGD